MAPALHIAIPSSSIQTDSSNRSYTAYGIILQLPLRKHELQKRYTDFLNLHKEICAQVNTPPPAPLPPKSWPWRTLNNPALTKKRQQGLEAYLRAIIESDDARWRSSSAWRAFLNLPAGVSTLNANGTLSSSPQQQRRPGSSGPIIDPNLWLDTHRTLKTQIQTTRQQLKQREAATTAQAQHTLSAEAKASLLRAATLIAQLDDGLKAISSANQGDDASWGGSKRLGDGEVRRRRDLIGAAKKEVEGLEGILKSLATRAPLSSLNATGGAAATSADKEALWKGTTAAKSTGRVLGGPLKETTRTRELDNMGVLQLQQQIMKEQDEDVLTLGKTVAKLKDMGIMINEELTIQNEMLGVVDADVDRVQGKVDVARRRIGKIS